MWLVETASVNSALESLGTAVTPGANNSGEAEAIFQCETIDFECSKEDPLHF